MADPKTVGTGPSRQAGRTLWPQDSTAPGPDEVGVCGGALFEKHSRPLETAFRLYGRLDLRAAQLLDDEQLVEAMASGGEVCLDVSSLAEAQPEALRLFRARQRSGQELAQRLAIRINPAQVPDLFGEQSPEA